MRTIKFRAWDTANNNYLLGLNILCGKDGFDGGWMGNNEDAWPFRNKEEVDLEQFTGLLDKNGKEIYEGDIITWGELASDRFGTVNFSVEYDARFASFGFRSSLGLQPFTWEGSVYPVIDVKVIGNIHENPDLLK